MDIRTCGKSELDALNERAKARKVKHAPNPEEKADQDGHTCGVGNRKPPTGQLLIFEVETLSNKLQN